ncbi:hypothetical protein OJAV_G00164580 [Oryzias javanicus]|uniref:Uncharacterized protein n=1 Tax=Oryzias javanicus TaxID=123683 RepID=A0A3S2NZQ0_ORYJA|nr:hypothetical protein OJAV_G00164580 [Oryzias javanicus]
MVALQSKWRYGFMFLGIQLVVMALLSREGNQRRVTYLIRIFRRPGGTSLPPRNGTLEGGGALDVYSNLSNLILKYNRRDDIKFCPKTSPFVGGPIHVSFPSGLTLAQVEAKNPLVLRGAVPAARLRGATQDGHHHPAPEPRAPPEVPAVLPAPVPAAAAAQLRHLHHPPGWKLHLQQSQAHEHRLQGGHEGGGLGLPLLPRRGPDP